MWTTQAGEAEGKGGARRAWWSEAESLDMWEGSLILLRGEVGTGGVWGQPRGVNTLSEWNMEASGPSVQLSHHHPLQTAGRMFHSCFSPKFNVMMMHEMSSRKYITLGKARQPAEAPYGRRGVKKRETPQTNSLPAMNKEKKTAAPSNTNNASDTWGYLPSKQQTPCESASPLCTGFAMKKIIPICQMNGNKQQIGSGFFFSFLHWRGRVGAAKLGGVLRSAKSYEDVCRKLGREGGCHFCQKPWVSEKPLQETWGEFPTRKTETKTFHFQRKTLKGCTATR